MTRLRRRTLLFASLSAMACGGPKAPPPAALHGTVVSPANPKPDFTLTAMDGRPFRFREATDGHLTLLFFGYTHCPDVCPLQMANMSAALHALPFDQQNAVRVVFVTTDPIRDSLPRLREWLGTFDGSFVGLRGSVEELHRIEALAGLGASFPDRPMTHDTSYTVSHAATVLAYTADDSLRAIYPFGVRQQEWAADLPRLLAMRSTQ